MASLSGDDKLMAHLNEMVQKLDAGTLSVGFHAGTSAYPDGTPTAMVAWWNEFGTGKIPPRPFFRQMIAAESPTWGGKLAKLLKVTDMDGEKSLKALGNDISGALSDSIQNFTTPANAPSTIAKKGFDKPLVETSHLQNSVTAEIN